MHILLHFPHNFRLSLHQLSKKKIAIFLFSSCSLLVSILLLILFRSVSSTARFLFLFVLFRHWFFRELMWAQIFRAGPSLMLRLVMRWSSVSSSSAWPSISCERKASATSPQPGNALMNAVTSSTLHCEGDGLKVEVTAGADALLWTR